MYLTNHPMTSIIYTHCLNTRTKNFLYTMKHIVYNVTGYTLGTASAPGSTKLIPGILGTI